MALYGLLAAASAGGRTRRWSRPGVLVVAALLIVIAAPLAVSSVRVAKTTSKQNSVSRVVTEWASGNGWSLASLTQGADDYTARVLGRRPNRTPTSCGPPSDRLRRSGPHYGEGRRLRKICATSADAQVELVRLQGEVHAQRHPRSDITVGQALLQWLDVADHQATTRERYDDLVRIYLTPTLGSMRASAVDAQLLERFYARLQRCRELCSGRPRTGHRCRPLANNTIRKLHSILSAAFDRAVRYGQLGVNPAELAEPPAFKRGDPDPPSPVEAAALLNAAWAEP